MDGAALADETGTERLQHAVRLDEHAPEALGVLRVIGRMRAVLGERDGRIDLVGSRVDVDLQVELPEGLHHGVVERGDRACLEPDRATGALARLDEELVRDEVEVDLEGPCPVRDRRRGEPARRHVEGDVPRVIDPRGLGEAELAHDLRPHVERRIGLLPVGERKARPRLACSHDDLRRLPRALSSSAGRGKPFGPSCVRECTPLLRGA